MSLSTSAPRALDHPSRRSAATTGWAALVVTEGLSVLVAATMIVSPLTILNEPRFQAGEGELLIRGWGVTWLALSVVVLVMLFTAFRRGERWAWGALAVVPLLWLAHFLLETETVHNLVLAVVTAAALVATRPRQPSPARTSPGS